MVQSIARLPESAKGIFRYHHLEIKNHVVYTLYGLFFFTVLIIRNEDKKKIVDWFKSNHVSFEAVIEQCIQELEDDHPAARLNMIEAHYPWSHSNELGFFNVEQWGGAWGKIISQFSKTSAGRWIADQYVEKLRTCRNWNMFTDTLDMKGVFQQEMKQKIREEIIQWHKK